MPGRTSPRKGRRKAPLFWLLCDGNRHVGSQKPPRRRRGGRTRQTQTHSPRSSPLPLADGFNPGETEDIFFLIFVTRAKRNKTINQHSKGQGKKTVRDCLFIHFISKAFECSVFTVRNSLWDESQCGWDITRLWQSGVPFQLQAKGGTMEGRAQLSSTQHRRH